MAIQTPGKSNQLLTPNEIAEEYGCPVTMIYRLIATRTLSAVRESARGRIRILRSDMERWVADHRTPTITDAGPEPPRVTADTLPGADRYVSS